MDQHSFENLRSYNTYSLFKSEAGVDRETQAGSENDDVNMLVKDFARIGSSTHNFVLRRILVIGGTEFLDLVDSLMTNENDQVILVDVYSNGYEKLKKWIGHPRFNLIGDDVKYHLLAQKFDQVYHLCPACLSDDIYNAKTIAATIHGTNNALRLCKRDGARILLAIMEDFTNDTISIAENLMFDYHRRFSVDIRVARIMNIDDSLVARDLVRVMEGNQIGPINIGNSDFASSWYREECQFSVGAVLLRP